MPHRAPTLSRLASTCLLLAAGSCLAPAQTPSAPSLATAETQAVAVLQVAPTVRVTAAGGALLLNAVLDAAQLERIEVFPGQALVVTLQYPLSMAGEEVIADPLDGGRIDGRPWRKLTVNALGQVLFTFTAGTNLGKYQVELRAGPGSAALEFWVNAASPTNP